MQPTPNRKPNRLIHATSPYLQQHAYNPVDWFEWGEESLRKAVEEDKPLLVSIGYSACHWCHVMERECFENEEIAQLMNQHFVCIKVDREERPDIDQIYMEALQAMNQNGGWPLNIFLTPHQKPFYGGTYFPPSRWSQLLLSVHQAFQSRRKEIDESSNELTHQLQTSDLQRFAQTPTDTSFEKENLDIMHQTLVKRFDFTWGGMDKSPKFVMPSIWQFLLRYHLYNAQSQALEMVSLTLLKMAQGGLYDQLCGGFARYSVDGAWFAPHFEKMLYDNAQLLSLYSEAYSLTQNERFKQIIEATCQWLKDEMTHPEGGFYSALDADSEGMEGKFYTWTLEELTRAVGRDSLVQQYFQITPTGNWEHGRNILKVPESDEKFRNENHLNIEAFTSTLAEEKQKMIQARMTRVRPGLDDKLLSGWNAMTVVGLTDVYKTFNQTLYLQMAIDAMLFLENRLIQNGMLLRSFKNKSGNTEAFLEDYGYLIQAYHQLYEVTFDENWIQKSEDWMNYVIQHFYDDEEKFFFYTSDKAEKLIQRKKEIFDNVIPSSNAIMARNLFRLGTLFEKNRWVEMASYMAASLQTNITSEPAYLSYWGMLLEEINYGITEIAIVGPQHQETRAQLQAKFLPFSIFCGTAKNSSLPLLKGRAAKDSKTWIFVCRNKTCLLPVTEVQDAINQIVKMST